MNYILGVINKATNKYENIAFVDKSNKYKCIACESDLILRKGEIRFQSFVHKNKNGCQYFKHPIQDQLVRDAKMHLQVLIEQNKVGIYTRCRGCRTRHKMNIPTWDETKSVKMEHDGPGVVYLDETNNRICGFNIYADGNKNTDTTTCLDISNTTYTINMLGLIHTCVQSVATKKIELICDNQIICHECASRTTD
jgi:hypothetical protein